jgi:hypothetical protein
MSDGFRVDLSDLEDAAANINTDAVSERLRCCVCGDATDGADDYVLLEVTAAASDAVQWLGAHAAHLNAALAPASASRSI